MIDRMFSKLSFLNDVEGAKSFPAGERKRSYWGVLFLFILLTSLLLATFPSAALAEEASVSSFSELFTKLDVSNYSGSSPSAYDGPTELTIQIKDDITLEQEITIPRGMTKLTIYLKGHTIDGDGNSFLSLWHQRNESIDLAILNDDSSAPSYTYDADNYTLTFEPSKMGTIKNCKDDAGSGAVISCDNGGGAVSVTLENILFEGCEASEDGSVVYLSRNSGKLNATGCIFRGNKSLAGYGGALDLFQSESNISYCLFSGNEACHEDFSEGGAISLGGVPGTGSLTIVNSEFINNKCAAYGGAIFQDAGAKLIIKHCKFEENASTKGGAINLDDCSVASITDSIFDKNIAHLDSDDYYGDGGALFVSPETGVSTGKITIKNSSFNNNSANGVGGAVYTDTNMDLINCVLTGNSAYVGGAIASVYPTEDVSFSISTDCKIYNNIASTSGSDIFLFPDQDEGSITLLSLPEAASMNATFRDSGIAIGAWFEDGPRRYAIDNPTDDFTVAQIKSNLSTYMRVALIAAPKQSIPSKIIYDSNGGNGTMNPTEGEAGDTVSIADNLFTYPSSKFVKWNTKADGTGTDYAPGASYTLTDSDLTLYAQWGTPVTVVKIWDDANDKDQLRPSELSVSLAQNSAIIKLADGTTDATHLLTAAEGWKYTFNLPAADYSHIELWEGTVAGYTKSQESKSFNDEDIAFVVINKHTIQTASIATIANANMVNINYQAKKTWFGTAAGPLPRPEITVVLKADGVELSRQTIPANTPDPATVTFTDIPKYVDNEGNVAVVYTIEEIITDSAWVKVGSDWCSLDGMGKYTPTITDVTQAVIASTAPLGTVNGEVENTYTLLQNTTTVDVTKLWKDHQNENGVRPGYLKLGLFKDALDADPVAVVSLTGPNNNDAWNGTFTGLPIYDANGQVIDYSTYTVKEAYPATLDDEGKPASWGAWIEDKGSHTITKDGHDYVYDYSVVTGTP